MEVSAGMRSGIAPAYLSCRPSGYADYGYASFELPYKYMPSFSRPILAAVDLFYAWRFPKLIRKFKRIHDRAPKLALPETYYDWMQWRKVFDHAPFFVILNDKLATKEMLSKHAPDLKLPRVLWVGDGSSPIPKKVLQGNVVVKANNASNRNFFIRDGKYDQAALERSVQGWRNAKPYGRKDAEWSYARIKCRIFVEEMLGDSDAGVIDINVRAGKGKVAYGTLLIHSKSDRESVIYLTLDGKRIGHHCGDGVSEADLDAIAIPDGYRVAVAYASRLSQDIDYARFDFLWSGGELYGGEITTYPNSGYGSLGDIGIDPATAIMNVWNPRSSWFLSVPQPGWRGVYRRMLLDELDRRHAPSIPGVGSDMVSPAAGRPQPEIP